MLTHLPTYTFPTHLSVVVALNCLLAGLVICLTYGLWRWRCGLVRLNAELQAVDLSPNQVGYRVTLQRVQLVETRFEVARWQLRSQQIKQLLRLVTLLRRLLFYGSMQRKSTFRSQGKTQDKTRSKK